MTLEASAHQPRDPEQHAFRVLEFGAVLEAVGRRATSGPGRERVLRAQPYRTVADASDALARVEAVRSLADRSEYAGVPAVPDAMDALSALRVQGSVLGGEALRRIQVLLESGDSLKGALKDPPPPLGGLRERLCVERSVARALENTVDADGFVVDRASSELARLRREIQKTGTALVRSLEKYAASLPDTYRVDDASVTVRGGRYVIPIRREGRSKIGGIVHDESASGATLFVEPPGQVEKMNRLRHLEGEEKREVTRILADRTEQVRPLADAMVGSLDALIEFDMLAAFARTANTWGAHAPELLEPGASGVRIVSGRHPLLLEKGIDAVPFDLELAQSERVVVVSGPNTGGKTVLLKSLGLIPLMAQSGIVPPVGPGTRLPVFDAFFADIGDEQSIQDDLSTFSGHIANVSSILERVGPASLVLLDELGTGTDPAEGAALARAVLESLEGCGCLTIATSHLGALKRIAEDSEAVVNASLQFDSERMEPTYRFVKGRPGRSFGIQIARKLELPAPLVTRSLALLDEAEVRADGLLARLEADEKKTRDLLDRLEQERAQAQAMLEDVTGREAELRSKEREADQRARDEARRLLLEARAEVEQAIQEGRRAAGKADAERAARRVVEQAAQRVAPTSDVPAEPESQAPPVVFAAGQRVKMKNGATGVLVEVAADRATVELDGGVRLQVRTKQLDGVSGDASESRRGTTHWTAPTGGGAAHEVDLRGLRVDEVESALGPAMDRAVLADLPALRIIHGMGTGAVRTRVGELVDGDPRVDTARAGERSEGGAGVTVVTFR